MVFSVAVNILTCLYYEILCCIVELCDWLWYSMLRLSLVIVCSLDCGGYCVGVLLCFLFVVSLCLCYDW